MDDQLRQIKRSKYFKEVKIIKTDRWKYAPTKAETKSKRKIKNIIKKNNANFNEENRFYR